MLYKFVLPFIGGNHPFSKADLEGVEVAAVLINAAEEKKRNENFLGIFKTYLSLWIVSIDGSNGIMVESLQLNSQAVKMRRFDKIIELDPDRDLASSSLADFVSKLKFFESRVNSYQKEAKLDLDGFLAPFILDDIRILFEKSEQTNVDDTLIMSQRLTQQAAEMMCAPIISIYHVDVHKILSDFYQLPLLIKTQLLQVYREFDEATNDYINRVTDLKQKVNSLDEESTFEKQQRAVETLTHELLSFRDTHERAIKKIHDMWDEINQLGDKIQLGYLNLISSIFQTKSQIVDLGVPLIKNIRQSEVISALLPIYFAVYKEKKNRIAYIPPFILHFDRKQELSRSKGGEILKHSLEQHYSQKIPPGLSQLDDYNLLLQPNTQKKFNDGVHKLRETKILSSNSYIQIMDTYNKFFREAQKP